MYSTKQIAHAALWAKRHLFNQLAVDELKFVKVWLQPTDICLDIGAHGGAWSVGCSNLLPAGHVYAFEALPYYAEVLQLTVRLLGRRNITVLNRAVTAEDKRMSLVWKAPDGRHLTGMTHLAGVEEFAEKTISDREINVEGLSIDTFQKSLSTDQRIRFIKIDVEGAELQVLQGASKLIERDRPLIYLELWQEYCRRYGYSTDDLFLHMQENNYKSFIQKHDGLVEIHRATYQGNGDVFFLPGEACERLLTNLISEYPDENA